MLGSCLTHYKKAPIGVGFDRSHHLPTTRSARRNDAKYIGLDVHQATISAPREVTEVLAEKELDGQQLGTN